jgi:hypothetical protein
MMVKSTTGLLESVMCRMQPALLAAAILAILAAHADAQGGTGGTPGAEVFSGVYDWGERSYEDEYTDMFEFVNNCDRPVVVTFDTRTVPFLQVMPRVDVAPGKNQIPITLEAPGWPDVPRCTDLRGALVVESSGYASDAGVCHPTQTTYTTTAHVHWWDRPAPPPKLKIAGPEPCVVWWNTGQRPPSTPEPGETACLDTIRKLADVYREWILAAAAGQPAERWAWLPTATQIASMSIDALLAMKRRANEQLGLSPTGL